MPKAKASKGKTQKATSASGGKSDSKAVNHVRVRMYRQGLGDCFLLSFASDGRFDDASHVLIDCGTLGATTTGVNMEDVAANIALTTKKNTTSKSELALLVATHEHQDHLSGFNSEQSAFDAIQVGHVWLAWTEDPDDPLAKKLAKYKGDLGLAALAASEALSKAGSPDSRANAMANGVRAVLSFVGGTK